MIIHDDIMVEGRDIEDHDYCNAIFCIAFLDMITVTSFTFGAMENWGLNVYLTGNVLPCPNCTLSFAIGTIIAHELAHQVSR